MISVILILLVAFSTFFPAFSYKSKWEDTLILSTARDIILTIDRTGNLYNYSFDSKALQNFLDTLIPLNESGLISWSETEGTIKNEVLLACNCTADQIRSISIWVKDLKINGREIKIIPLSTSLDKIQASDVLLIWGRKELSNYLEQLQEYLGEGNGIVEIADFRVDSEVDVAQQQIFGLSFVERIRRVADYDQFVRQPDNSTDIIYGPYKYFYHIPLPLLTSPSELSIPGCQYSPSNSGNLTLNQTYYKFWICDENSVWFDTDGDKVYDKKVDVGENFKIEAYDFTLKYIEDNEKIGVSFKPSFRFADFLYTTVPPGEPDPQGWAYGTRGSTHLEPIDGSSDKILIKAVFSNPPRSFPVVILNSSKVTKTAWMADFTDELVGDEHRLLLISLILWTSNKERTGVLFPNLKIGYITPYVNVNNTDMFEVYNLNLGLGFPYY